MFMGDFMRFNNYITELASIYGKGITFIDIDETIYHTFAKIHVINDKSGAVVQSLNNQEFNTYSLPDGHHFDFAEFKNAKLFNKTSIPIPATVNRIKRMFKNIGMRGSKVIFLTARADFDDKEVFLDTFRQIGIPIDDIYAERAGNDRTGTAADMKKRIVMKYINTGEYRRVRMLDDDMANLKTFLKLQNEVPPATIKKIMKKYNIQGEESIPVIEFYALFVNKTGALSRIK
jgi:hypothetical protein